MFNKKNKNKSKKYLDKEILENLEYYKDTNDKYTYYTNYDYLSHKDKESFDNKFSKPKNKNQYNYLRMLNKKQIKIIVSTGPAGTGKTLLATENAIKQFLLGKCDKIIFTRPSVSVDEDLGFLPGTLEEKMAPWIRPIYDILYNFIHPNQVKELFEEKLIEIAPLGFMRGRTFKNCWIIADEMQNSTIPQMKMLLTRIGENTKLVITGDLEQNDIHNEINGLEDFLNKFKGRRSDSIGSVEFIKDDIEREEVVKEILEIYGSIDIPVLYKDNLYNTHLKDKTIDEPEINKIAKIKSACSLQKFISKIEISEMPIVNSFVLFDENTDNNYY
jgi:phosphate starvation-inducible PhoH-like protein